MDFDSSKYYCTRYIIGLLICFGGATVKLNLNKYCLFVFKKIYLEYVKTEITPMYIIFYIL